MLTYKIKNYDINVSLTAYLDKIHHDREFIEQECQIILFDTLECINIHEYSITKDMSKIVHKYMKMLKGDFLQIFNYGSDYFSITPNDTESLWFIKDDIDRWTLQYNKL